MNDAELLVRFAREGSQTAFTELVQRHVNFVYGWALRRVSGDRMLAEEIAQQVFTALAREADRLVNRDSLPGWLYVTTRHVAAAVLRSELRRRNREHSADIMTSNPSGAVESAEAAELIQTLAGALDTLGQRDRDAVLLRYFANLSYADIGSALKLSEDGARSRVNRALDQLRGHLERRGVRSTSAVLTAALTEQSLISAPSGLSASIAAHAFAGVSGSGGALPSLLMHSKTALATTGVAALIGVLVFTYVSRKVSTAATDLNAATTANRALSTQKVASRTTPAAAVTRPPTNAGRAAVAGVAPSSADSISAADIAHRALIERRNYGPIFQKLGLSQPQIDAATDQSAKTYLKLQAITSAAMQQGIPLTDPSVSTQRQQARAELYQQWQGMLDPAAYQQLYEYSHTVSISAEVVAWVAKNVSDTSTPLTSDEASQLTRILASHSANYRAGGEVGGDVDWAGVVADATPVLAPDQLIALKQRATHLAGAWQGRIGMPWTLP